MRAQETKRGGFTLIELMIAMLLMSMVTATCIWVFRQSLNIYNKSTGNAEVNQNWRIAMEKINMDLSACLPLNSGEQRFLMISRFANDEEFGKPFPRDYLSFTTTTRVQGTSTTAQVSYDIIETASQLPILMRYITKVEDLTSGGANGLDTSHVFREVLAEYCTMFRIEYRWEDPRPAGAAIPGAGADEKMVPQPGVFLSLNPGINEDAAGVALNTTYLAGGLNGISVVQNPAGSLHAPAGDVMDGLYNSYLIDSSGGGVATGGVQIPFRMDGSNLPILEPFKDSGGSVSWIRKRGTVSAGVQKVDTNLPDVSSAAKAAMLDRNRVIMILSPNLWHGSTLDPSDNPLDITANFSMVTGVNLAQFYTQVQDFVQTTPYCYQNPAGVNEVLWPTYVPRHLRITMKIYNKSRTSMITREKVFWIPSSGS